MCQDATGKQSSCLCLRCPRKGLFHFYSLRFALGKPSADSQATGREWRAQAASLSWCGPELEGDT